MPDGAGEEQLCARRVGRLPIRCIVQATKIGTVLHLGATDHQRQTAACQKLRFPLTHIVSWSTRAVLHPLVRKKQELSTCIVTNCPRAYRNLLFSTHLESRPVRWDDEVHEQRDKTDDKDPTIKPQTRHLAQKCVSGRGCAATRHWTELSTEHFSIGGISVLLAVRVWTSVSALRLEICFGLHFSQHCLLCVCQSTCRRARLFFKRVSPAATNHELNQLALTVHQVVHSLTQYLNMQHMVSWSSHSRTA